MRPYIVRIAPVNDRNIFILCGLITFWIIGAIYPLIFWPRSYALIKDLEHKVFPIEDRYKFDKHMFSHEVYEYIQKFADFYSHKITVFTLAGRTYENRSIKVVRLSMPEHSRNFDKKANILVVAAVRACAWDSVSTALDLIHKLTEDCYYKVPYLLDYNWYIIPIFNPDGYDYTLSRRNQNPKSKFCEKNRVLLNSRENRHGCRGVALDRNFGFHWGESKPRDYENFCSDFFAGFFPFSEFETKVLKKFVKSLYVQRKPIKFFFQLHSATARDDILYPWRFTSVEPFNQKLLNKMAQKAANEVNFLTGSNFSAYQSGRKDFASGVMADYLMAVYKVTLNFIIEPDYQPANDTEEKDQQYFIQKTTTIVFSLLREYNHIVNVTSSLDVSQLLMFTLLLILSCY